MAVGRTRWPPAPPRSVTLEMPFTVVVPAEAAGRGLVAGPREGPAPRSGPFCSGCPPCAARGSEPSHYLL